tara:strand:+ start:4177 stop:4461 length:285 start_codon:yes stop_codon:yes gene_type:complete
MNILEKSKSELSNSSAYPIIKVSNKCGYWRAYYKFKNHQNITKKIFEDRSHNYSFSAFENAKRAAELCAVMHVSKTSEIIASGYDADDYFFIVG